MLLYMSQEKVSFVANYLFKGGSPFRKLPAHRFTKILGAGTYGAALQMKDGKDEVVVKISDPGNPEEYKREVALLQKLNCKKNNVPCFRATLNFPVINAYAMTSNINSVTFHSFYEVLLSNPITSKVDYIETIDFLFGNLYKTIGYVHSLGIIHNDIKSDNILIERREDGTIIPILIDFGISLTPDRYGKVQSMYIPTNQDTYRVRQVEYYGPAVSFDLYKNSDYFTLARTFWQPKKSPYIDPCRPVKESIKGELRDLLFQSEPVTPQHWLKFKSVANKRYSTVKRGMNIKNKYYSKLVYNKKVKLATPVSMDIDLPYMDIDTKDK